MDGCPLKDKHQAEIMILDAMVSWYTTGSSREMVENHNS
jgi:hypothetical protein